MYSIFVITMEIAFEDLKKGTYEIHVGRFDKEYENAWHSTCGGMDKLIRPRWFGIKIWIIITR